MSWKTIIRKELVTRLFSKKEIQDISNDNYMMADMDIKMEQDPSAIFPMKCYICDKKINNWADGSKVNNKEVCSSHLHDWVDKRHFEHMATPKGQFSTAVGRELSDGSETLSIQDNINYDAHRAKMGELQ